MSEEYEVKQEKTGKQSEPSEEPKNFKFFCHSECEFFPCHEVKKQEEFNCLFCYCPLYALGDGCGGNFTYNEKGIKDCTNCLIPHSPGGYEYVTEGFSKIVDLIKKEQNI